MTCSSTPATKRITAWRISSRARAKKKKNKPSRGDQNNEGCRNRSWGSGNSARLGASLLCGGVRPRQGRQPGMHHRQDGVGESARLDSRRREESGWHFHRLDDRSQYAQRAAAAWIHETVAGGRN